MGFCVSCVCFAAAIGLNQQKSFGYIHVGGEPEEAYFRM